MITRHLISTFITLCVVLNVGIAQESETNKTTPRPVSPNSGDESIDDVLKRVESLERELRSLKLANGQPVDAAKQRAMLLINAVYLQQDFTGNGGARILVVKATALNLTDHEVTIAPENYALKADGKSLSLGKLPARLANSSFTDGAVTMTYSSLKTSPLTLDPGQSGQTWLLFYGLSEEGPLTSLNLTMQPRGEQPIEIDLIETLGQQLRLKTERIGPRKSLALLTIGGSLTQLSLNRLLSEIEKLNESKVARFVVRWHEGASSPDQRCLYWLQEIARQGGSSERQDTSFPPFPSGVGEFHIVTPHLKRSRNGNAVMEAQPRQHGIHDSVDEAVSAALASAYQVIPRDELLDEIRNGHGLTQAAALTNGGSRLTAEDLPLILELADSKQLEVQKAALRSLRHFGEATAIEKLLSYARRNTTTLSDIAIDSLAGSRFGVAHDALLTFLKSETTNSRKSIVVSLGRHARPIWSETLHGYVLDPNSDVRVEALQALKTVGHPQLAQVLEACLEDENRALAETALLYLSERDDRRSEQTAMAYTLKALEKGLPTPVMVALLQKTKDQRAVSLLTKHLDQRNARRREIIDLIGQIGDEKSIGRLAELYDSFETYERVAALNTLSRLKSPVFRDLAAREINGSDGSVIAQAAALLQSDSSPQSIEVLVNGFKKPGNDNRFQILSNALGNIGTPEARAALREALKLPQANRRQLAQAALRNLANRSPASQYLYRGRDLEEQMDLIGAMKSYDQGVDIDPEHPETRVARANLSLKKDLLDKAAIDFEKLNELDPTNSQGPTGLAIVLARQGKLDAAEKAVESARRHFETDNLFLYNACCVYSRAFEWLQTHEGAPDREAKIKRYEAQAIADLEESVKHGLEGVNLRWMLDDPDLVAIRQHPGFQAIAKTIPKDE